METLAAALVLGLTAGVSPGPLLTLVVSSTLERGFGAGVRVALAPALSDAPIIAICLLVLRDLEPGWLAAITALGGGFLIWIGLHTVRSAGTRERAERAPASRMLDLRRGVLVNLLNPNPWLFWIGVGGPIFVAAWRDQPPAALGFLAIFYTLLVGSKVVLAWVTARGSQFLNGRWYRRLVVASGLVLAAMGVGLIWRAVGGALVAAR